MPPAPLHVPPPSRHRHSGHEACRDSHAAMHGRWKQWRSLHGSRIRTSPGAKLCVQMVHSRLAWSSDQVNVGSASRASVGRGGRASVGARRLVVPNRSGCAASSAARACLLAFSYSRRRAAAAAAVCCGLGAEEEEEEEEVPMERRLISAPTTSTAEAARREDATELSRARCRMAVLELSSSLRRSRALATRLLRSRRWSSSAAEAAAEMEIEVAASWTYQSAHLAAPRSASAIH